MYSSQQPNFLAQSQKVEHASNLFHSEYLEHLRNSSPNKAMIKEYSEILDLEKKNMRTLMTHLLNNNQNVNPQEVISLPTSQRPLQFSSTLTQNLPREIDTQLRELKTSISSLEKRPIVLGDCRDADQEKQLKSEIVKLNKEILGLQSDLYKLNVKYISKGFLSPGKLNNQRLYGLKTEEFTTPERSFPTDHETTARNPNNATNQGNRILGELNIFLEKITKSDPILFSRYFNSPENLRRMAAQMDHSSILLNLVQLFNEHLTNDSLKRRNPSENLRPQSTNPYSLDAEMKPIDFRSYFRNNYINENQNQVASSPATGILRNKPQSPQPRLAMKTPASNRHRAAHNTEDASQRDSRYSLERDPQANKLYNNRSESERFLHEEQGYDIDDIPHKKKVKQAPVKKRKNIDIINHLPKKKFPS